MASGRTATLTRETSESSITLSIDLDGTGTSDIHTTVPFFDHLLTAFAKHSLIDLTVKAQGDTEIDVHLPGGPLHITVARETLDVTMRGPAKQVFSGEVRVQ